MTALLAFLLAQVDVETELRVSRTVPKFRVRDGHPGIAGWSVFSDELDAESPEAVPGIALRAISDRERVTLDFWRFEAEGDGALESPKFFGGTLFPAGTRADAEVLFQHLEIDARHRFDLLAPPDTFWLDAGLAIEYLVFDADLGFGRTRLHGVYPAPRLTLGYVPVEPLKLEAGIGGFFIPFVNGDTDILDPIEYRLAVSVRWKSVSLKAGYELYHVHLEENSTEPEEDVVHMRLRSLFLALQIRF